MRRKATCAWIGSLAILLVAAWSFAADEKKDAPQLPPMVKLTLRLEAAGKPDMKVEDLKYHVFPSGKRCAFTFFGARTPATIEVLTKLGFGTTVYLGPQTSPEALKALEKAGADIGIDVWGAKGTYSSHIGANTIQEAFDAVATSRMVMRKSCVGPLACGAIGGHYSTRAFPVSRDPDNGSGFGYAYHDANYLMLSDNKEYMVYLGRQRGEVLGNRENFDNRMDSREVPNEIIYYQMLANQFRGTLLRAAKGQIVRFSLRDFKAPDLKECSEVIGDFGKHELVWNASEAQIGANEYIQQKVHVLDAKTEGGAVVVTLGVEEDAFLPFLLTPLPFAMPKGVKVSKAAIDGVDCAVIENKDGVFVDVPVARALSDGFQMTVVPSAPDMTAPDEMPLAVTMKNTGDKPIAGAKLRWVGSIDFAVSGGDKEPFDLPAGGEKKFDAVAKTGRAARFGMTPFTAVIAADAGGAKRTFMSGFEVVVAPRLRVEIDPMQRIPLAKGRTQHFFVHIDNRKTTMGGPPNTLISHKAGPCKGTVSFDLPEGMTAIPAEQPFVLGENEAKTLIFQVRNDAWGDEIVYARPMVKFEGEKDALCVLHPGTTVTRSQAMLDFKPLDDKGLLVYASWDDQSKGASYDKACGSTRAGQSGSPCIYTNEGVKGWAVSARMGALCDSYKNIDYQQGTILFWMRKDPQVRNENTYVPDPAETAKVGSSQWNNNGECIFGMNSSPQIADTSQSGITLRRYRSWKGKGGYLQATYEGMGRQIRFVQVPYEWTEEWRHVAVLWDTKAKRLEVYLDGKLAGKADAGKDDWYGAPWDKGRPSGEIFSPISCDHGKWTGTQRDEFYTYNRPLTPEEIEANRKAAGK